MGKTGFSYVPAGFCASWDAAGRLSAKVCTKGFCESNQTRTPIQIILLVSVGFVSVTLQYPYPFDPIITRLLPFVLPPAGLSGWPTTGCLDGKPRSFYIDSPTGLQFKPPNSRHGGPFDKVVAHQRT